jgi:hypothetical protein
MWLAKQENTRDVRVILKSRDVKILALYSKRMVLSDTDLLRLQYLWDGSERRMNKLTLLGTTGPFFNIWSENYTG